MQCGMCVHRRLRDSILPTSCPLGQFSQLGAFGPTKENGLAIYDDAVSWGICISPGQKVERYQRYQTRPLDRADPRQSQERQMRMSSWVIET